MGKVLGVGWGNLSIWGGVGRLVWADADITEQQLSPRAMARSGWGEGAKFFN